MGRGLSLRFDVSEKIVILGMSGMGKTTLMKYLIQKLPFRKVVVDRLGILSRVRSPREVGVVKCRVKNADFCVRLVTPEDLEKFMSVVINYKNLMVFIDEVDTFISPTASFRTMPNTYYFLNAGRNFGLGLTVTVRQVGRLNKVIWSNANWFFVFRIINPRDLEYLRLGLGFDVPANQLDKHEFFIIDAVHSEIIGRAILKENNIFLLR